MKPLMQTIAELDSRLGRIEQFLGLLAVESTHTAQAARKLLPKPKAAKNGRRKAKIRQHANKKEGQRTRQEILAFLKTRTKPVHKSVIGQKVRVKSEGALGWYLKDLRQGGKVKMTARGMYKAV